MKDANSQLGLNADIQRIHISERSSKIVIYNGLVMLSGQTPDDWSLEIKGQTIQVLAKIDALLEEAGTDKSRLLTAQIWMRDPQTDFDAVNEVWNAWVVPGCCPARASWEARTAAPDIRVEIMVTAAARVLQGSENPSPIHDRHKSC